jgi:hypothetical protein
LFHSCINRFQAQDFPSRLSFMVVVFQDSSWVLGNRSGRKTLGLAARQALALSCPIGSLISPTARFSADSFFLLFFLLGNHSACMKISRNRESLFFSTNFSLLLSVDCSFSGGKLITSPKGIGKELGAGRF